MKSKDWHVPSFPRLCTQPVTKEVLDGPLSSVQQIQTGVVDL